MTVEGSLGQLTHDLNQLHEALQTLRLNIAEDAPADLALIDLLAESTTEALGCTEEARKIVTSADPGRLPELHKTLTTAQHNLNRALSIFSSSLDSHEVRDDLTNLATNEGKAWPSWVDVVNQQLAECRRLLFAVNQSLLACWQELGGITAGALASDKSPGSSSSSAQALQYAYRLFDNCTDWYKNADAKAQILLGLDGAFLAFLTSSAFAKPSDATSLFSKFRMDTWIFLALMCATLVVSIFSALRCLASRTYSRRELREIFRRLGVQPGSGKRYPPEVMWFFQLVRALDATEFKDQILTVDDKFATSVLASQASELSGRITQKHFWVNVGFTCAGASLILFVTAMVSYVARAR
jgi:hypothetical protein